MPTKGTTPTQIRLTDDDRAKLKDIEDHFGLPSLAAAVRYCANQVHRTLFLEPEKPVKKSRKHS